MVTTSHRVDRAPDLSIVIPARNAADHLRAQLEALSGQVTSLSLEVIVADNGSRDGTVQLVRDRAATDPLLRIVDASERRGAGHARNVGAWAARARRIAFVDADDVADPHWAQALHDALDHADLVGGHLRRRTLNSTEVWASRPIADGSVHHQYHLPWVGGGNLGCHRYVLDATGGFDPALWRSCEEMDFCWRAQLLGFRLSSASGAVVDYRYRDRAGSLWRQGVAHGWGEREVWYRHRGGGMRLRPPTLAWLVTRTPNLLRGRGRRGRWLYGAGVLVGDLLARCSGRGRSPRAWGAS